ncbi:MAG: lysophospholipid acyltransferase family protein [Actinomycetota bacterium]
MDVYQQLFYNTCRWTAGPLVALAIRLRCEGAQNVPAEGGALVVANHRNPVLDPFAMAMKVERPINFVAASVFFHLPVVSTMYRAWGAISLELEGGEKSKVCLDEAVSLLRDGELVGMFPEGVHTIANIRRAHKIRTFRTGFARIALTASVPIVPVALIGKGERTLARFPSSMVKPFFDHPDFANGAELGYYKRLTIRIGRPLDLSGFQGEPVTSKLIGHVSGKVRRVVSKLYDGEDMDRFFTGEAPFDISYDRV